MIIKRKKTCRGYLH